jgi:hypothetical protein
MARAMNLDIPATPLSPEATATMLSLKDASGPGGGYLAHYSTSG